MKLIGRILIILTAAAVIAGLAVALVNSGILNLDGGHGGRGELREGFSLAGGELGGRGDFGEGRERGGDEIRAAGWGLGTVLNGVKNLAVIGLIVAGVALIGFGSSRIFRQPPGGTKAEKFDQVPVESGGGDGG